jgi:hypothetical protein
MRAAANILDSLILNNIMVTIQVGYGDWGQPIHIRHLGSNEPVSSPELARDYRRGRPGALACSN